MRLHVRTRRQLLEEETPFATGTVPLLVPLGAVVAFLAWETTLQVDALGGSSLLSFVLLTLLVILPVGWTVGTAQMRQNAQGRNLARLRRLLGGSVLVRAVPRDLASAGEYSYAPRLASQIRWRGTVSGRRAQVEQVLEQSSFRTSGRLTRTIYRVMAPLELAGALILGDDGEFRDQGGISNLWEGNLPEVYPERRSVRLEGERYTVFARSRRDLEALLSVVEGDAPRVRRLFHRCVKAGALVFAPDSLSARVRYNALHTVVGQPNLFEPEIARMLLEGLAQVSEELLSRPGSPARSEVAVTA